MSSRDNWERLVAAVLKREQLWQLCHAPSRSPSISSIASDITSDFSGQIHNNSLNPISVSPPPSVPQVSNNASGPRKLFSAWYRRRKQKAEYWVDVTEDIGIHLQRVRRFSLRELQVATVNFSNKNVIGYEYNMVYKGWLADGSPVAVRRYKDRGGSQSEEAQFQKVVEVNSIAAHPNVLHVLGFCTTQKELLLVYPLMVNGSVASCIRDRHKSQPPLNWPIRKGIALGAARGLAYLHEECSQKIIHRDIKAANVLLDEDFEAFIADFELAIIMDHDDTDFEDEVRGTIGHIAPEYLSTGRCSEKTDVFGYGIFLLELITGQRAIDFARLENDEDVLLLDWVKRNYKEGMWEMMVDADCRGNYMEEVVEQLVQIALFCTQYTPEGRPRMSEVVTMLEVGDGVAERWEEWYKKEVEEEICRQVVEINETYSSNIIFHIPGEKDLVIQLGQARRFTLHELHVATENFSKKNVLEYGNNMFYNKLYKGWLADGSPVAVKIHKDRCDLSAEQQFQKVVEINSIAAHPNVLHMLGICITPKEPLIIYPLMVNGCVESWLRGRHKSKPPLNWPIRKGIALGAALGAARGLAHLHYDSDKKIIHCDVKAANIMLDENFEAVVADFEFAIIMDHDVAEFEDAIHETMGHIAPEYLSTGLCSEKTEVFGYGMLLLELITGQRASDLAWLANDEDMMILDWVWEMMVDPDCGGNYIKEEVEQLISIALLCTKSTPQERPKMSEVVMMLEANMPEVISEQQVEDHLPGEWYKEEIFRRQAQQHWCKEEMFHQESRKIFLTASDMFGDDIFN